MCDPVSLAIMAGTKLASSYLENKAAKKVNSARSGVIERNIADQKKYQAISQAALNTSQQVSGRPAIDQATADAAAANTTAYQAPINPGELLPGQGNSSDAVKQAIVGALTSGVNNAKQTAGQKALLDAYGNATFNRDLTVNRSAGDIATQNNFGAGRAGLVPLQLEAANRAGDRYSSMAGFVNALGTVAGAGYGAGAGNSITSRLPIGKFSGGYGTYGDLGRINWYPRA